MLDLSKMSELEKDKHFLKKGFEVITKHVNDILENHNVIPATVSIPYHENGEWIRLSLNISAVRVDTSKTEEEFQETFSNDAKLAEGSE